MFTLIALILIIALLAQSSSNTAKLKQLQKGNPINEPGPNALELLGVVCLVGFIALVAAFW